MILTEIQIRSLIVCAALIVAVCIVGSVAVYMEREEERRRIRRITKRLNHERNYNVYNRF